MDDDDRELIIQLCTRAGMMMEDASVAPVTSAGLNDNQLMFVVHDLMRSVADLTALMAAARVLLKPSKAPPVH